MPEKKQTRKRVGQYMLPVDLIRQVQDEALDHRLWPAHVVEERLRHSYAESPDLPGEHAARELASA